MGDTYPFDKTWKLILVDMEGKFGVWLMPTQICAKIGNVLWGMWWGCWTCNLIEDYYWFDKGDKGV